MTTFSRFASRVALSLVGLVVAVASAGSSTAAPRTHPSPPNTAIPYSCDGLAGRGPAVTSDPAVARLVTLADRKEVPTDDEIADAAARTRAWLRSWPAVSERVVAQNAAFAVASRAPSAHGKNAAAELVRALAPTPAELAALGDAPAGGVDTFVGPEDWVPRRAPSCGEGPLVHDYAFGGRYAFRLVRTGQRRALVAQLVAMDTEGKAHVTPVVGLLEMRLGLDHAAPACVVHLGATHGVVALVPEQHEDLGKPPFVVRAEGGRVMCEGCHRGFEARDIAADEATALLGPRRTAFLRFANDTWSRTLAPSG